MIKTARTILFCALTSLILAVLPSEGSPSNFNLNNGISFYKAKNYLMAVKLLEKAVKEHPRSWKAHYYLGNACMALGRFNTATYHYELVRDLSPDKSVQRYAGLAIVKMENMKLRYNIAQVSTGQTSTSQTGPIDHEGEKKANRARIIAEGEAQARRIETQAENQIKNEKANSNWWFIWPNGEMVMDIPWWRENQIRQEAKSHADHVRQTASNNAANVH